MLVIIYAVLTRKSHKMAKSLEKGDVKYVDSALHIHFTSGMIISIQSVKLLPVQIGKL